MVLRLLNSRSLYDFQLILKWIRMRILVLLHGTTIMHRNTVGLSWEEPVRQVLKGKDDQAMGLRRRSSQEEDEYD